MYSVPIFPQYSRSYAAVSTAAKTTYSDLTGASLLYQAGPDGSIITKISAVPRATVTVTQMQLFLTTDGGTTIQYTNSVLMAAYTMAQTTATPVTNFLNVDGLPISEGNPIRLGGVSNFMAPNTTITFIGVTGGAADVQTAAFPTTFVLTSNAVLDFEAGLTNATTTPTLNVNGTGAKTIIRADGTALVAGDITKGFRYRVIYDGTNYRLQIASRLYVGAGVALAGGIVTTAQGMDY